MLREQIVTEIMKLVRPAMIQMDHKPSIDEIEKMLNSDNPHRISIAPDGAVMVEAPTHTVGDIADAVLRVRDAELERLLDIEAAATTLLTTGVKTCGAPPQLVIIEKDDKSDAHYRLCSLLKI